MRESKRPLKVFLCHASIDKPKVRELYRYLRKRGINPWFDEEHLVGGQDWQVEIPKALATSDAIIICLTKSSVDKEGYVQKEIKFALDKALEMPEGRIFLIPVKFEECEVPFTLSRYQWVDLTIEAGYSKMMKALKFRASQLERATVELPKKAVEEERLVLEKAAKEKTEREVAEKATRENAEKDAAEKAQLEAEELTRKKIAKQKAEREAAEKTAREKARLQAEELAKQKAAKEKAKRDADEKAAHEKEKLVPEPEIKKPQGNSNAVFWIVGIIFAIILVIWVSSLNGTPSSPVPTSTPIQTMTPPQPFIATDYVGPLASEITDDKGVKMALVPAGIFAMGSDNDGSNEKPVHEVYLNSYYMDIFEVTNAAYKKCVENGVCQSPIIDEYSNYNNSADAQNPVVDVDWYRAKTYCEWRGARLPTEAEWEKAARGTDQRYYPWGNEGINCDRASYGHCSNFGDVGRFENGKSPYGMYDMAGSVWEWTSSIYLPYPYDAADGRENMSSSDDRVVRGGSSYGDYYVNENHSSYRLWFAPDYFGIGIRCASNANP